ncbi:MAG: hypothetical protein WA913_09935 [Pricia sp.]
MNAKSFLKTLSIIHAGLLASLTGFAIFCYFQVGSFEARMSEGNLFIYLVPVAAVAGYFLSQWVFRKQIQSISKNRPLLQKLEKYQKALLIKYALLEGPGFLAVIAYYLSGNALHLVIAIALIVYLFVQRPTVEKIKADLPLSYEEEKEFK